MKLMKEAEEVFQKLSIHQRFNKQFREAEIWAYSQKNKEVSRFIITRYVKTSLIPELIKEGVIREKRNNYQINNLNKELFKKIIKEERILAAELSQLCFGETEETYTESLDLLLVKMNNEDRFIKEFKKEYSPGLARELKEFHLIQEHPNHFYKELGTKNITKELTKSIMKHVLKKNHDYLTYLKKEIIKNHATY